MRLILSLFAFWLLVALGIAVLLVLSPPDRGDRDETGAPPPLSCASLGDRARRCKKALLDTAGDFVEKASVRAGRSPFTAGGRRLALTTLLEGLVSQGKLRRECDALRAEANPLVERLWKELTRCWPERDCRAFVGCLRRVAEAEEKAGRLPL